MKKLFLIFAAVVLAGCGDDLGWDKKVNTDAKDCYDTIEPVDSGVCNLCQDATETDVQSDTQTTPEDVTVADSSDSVSDAGNNDTGDTGDDSDVPDAPGDATETDADADVVPPPECVTATDCAVISVPCVAPGCEAGKCVLVPFDTPCSDDNECTVGDQCQLGQCVAGIKPNCDDLNPCTDDSCDPLKGCVHLPNQVTCTDDNACTSEDVCFEGSCKGGPVDCGDANPCTDDSCDKLTGCVNLPNTATCVDGNGCTENDVCKDKVCTPGPAFVCDDNNPCTSDSCESLPEEIHVCTFASNDLPCDDGDLCTLNDKCAGSKCVSGASVECLGSACVLSSCMAGKCVEDKTMLDDVKCDDGKACTALAKCLDGKCLTVDSKNCDDANSCTTESCNANTGACDVSNVQDDTPCGKDSVCIAGVCKLVQTCGDVDSDGDGTNDKCDCEPLNKFVSPNLSETCDGADNNCNNQVDEGQVCGTTGIVQVTAVNGSTKESLKDVVISIKPAGKCSATADLAPAILTSTTPDTGKSTLKPDPGDYCIEATLKDFKKAITSDFSIVAGEVRPLVVPLVPSTVNENLISVCGLVTDASSKLPIAGASVSVAVNAPDNVVGTAKSDVTGLYCVVGIKGVTNAIVSAVAEGYVSATKNITPPANGVGIVQDFELLVSVAGVCYSDDFENGLTGWTIDSASAGNQWQVIDNAVPMKNKDFPVCVNVWPSEQCNPNPNDISDSCQICGNSQQLACIPEAGSLPRSYKGTHALWYGALTTGNFNGTSGGQCGPKSGGNGPANGGTITTPEQVLQNGTSSYILKFAYWYEIEGVAPQYPTFDSMNIYVSLNGGAFSPVGHLNPSTSFGYQGPDAYTSGGGGQAPAWGVREIALTNAKAGDKLKVKFEFKTGDGAFNAFRGWVIDDLKVVGAGCK